MDLAERIARRRATSLSDELLVDLEVLSPAHHAAEPVGRGGVLERLLDALDPLFHGSLPPNTIVYGPKGVGKSALLTALMDGLRERLGRTTALATTTRGARAADAWFVYVDAREATSPFKLYRTLLERVSPSAVPERGVGTAALRDRLVDRLSEPNASLVACLDHADDPSALTPAERADAFAPIDDNLCLLTVQHELPEAWRGHTVEVGPYRRHALTDVLTARASRGLARGAIEHDQLREIAEQADGDAHDALAILYGAAVIASADDATRISHGHVVDSIATMPAEPIHIARVLALPENRRTVLLALLDLADDRPIAETADAIANRMDLSAGTVKRYLYELADQGILERIDLDRDVDGRQPTAVIPRFPPLVFQSVAQATLD